MINIFVWLNYLYLNFINKNYLKIIGNPFKKLNKIKFLL